jgi:rhamnose transport system permease protein
VRDRTREISLAIAIAGLGGLLAVVAPGFFTPGNLRDLTMTNMPVLIVALGMTLVILTGQIDISVGSVFAICSVIAGVTAKTGAGILASAAAACATGAALGALNGALITKAKIPSIVVTLATMVALRDGLRWITQGAWVQDLPPDFQAFGHTREVSQAITVAIAAAMVGAMLWGLRNLAAGRAVYATGSNAEGARLAGIEPTRVVFCVFTLTGALTGAAALLNSARFNQIPSNAGIGMEMQVIAAVIVGGVSVNGGRGSVGGALLGVVLLGMIGPALTFLGISAYWERALQGAIILTAVAIDALRGRSEKHAGILAARA